MMILNGLLVFLLGCLVVAIVVYVAKLILGMLDLPPEIRQIALIIIALLALVGLLILVVYAINGGVTIIHVGRVP